MMETQWKIFQTQVEKAGVTNMHAWVSVPTTSGMDAKMKSGTEVSISNTLSKIKSLVGTPKQATHPFQMPQTHPVCTMWVTKQNQVFMGGVHYP